MRTILLSLLASVPAIASAAQEKIGHAVVEYENIDAAYAKALGRTLDAAWKVYTTRYGFDMPQTVVLRVECGPDNRPQLFTDGSDHVTLVLDAPESLERPEKTGIFHLYGMCHELGHIAMYRTLKDRDWTSGAACEGWAHYAGSVVVDAVYAAEGEGLWPDAYDYRADGTARLNRQIADGRKDFVIQGAALWKSLEGILGAKAMRQVFQAWQNTKVDPTSPSMALQAALLKVTPAKEKELNSWWSQAAPVLVEKRMNSKFKPVVVPAAKLSGRPLVVKYDDDASEGKKSFSGGGHAVQFTAPAGEWYIRAVSLYGSRYGRPQPPPNQFDVALCDEQLKTIVTWKKPYATFERGDMKWVRMEVPPTRVPVKFTVCFDFKPTATMGVYTGWDANSKGHSLVGTPGRPGEPFEEGDWMIRIELDQTKESDALKGK